MRRCAAARCFLAPGYRAAARSPVALAFQPQKRFIEDKGNVHMSTNTTDPTDDPHDLDRFVKAQEGDYQRALSEISSGRKRSHWMWFIFPQYEGLGLSSISRRYAIKSVQEAEAYLKHPVLGPRLVECATAALAVEGRSASEIFGSPDDMKLRSSATLFAFVSPPGSVFSQLLEKFFHGEPDKSTLDLIEQTRQAT
jgi:uncharacterized protein (DUF1810 family)